MGDLRLELGDLFLQVGLGAVGGKLFIGGLTLATAMAIGVEFLNGRLRFEEEVEHYLELPVLAVIPDFENSPDLANA